MEVLQIIRNDRKCEEKSMILVEGGAGTGKTILAVYLMKLLSEVNLKDPFSDPEEIDDIDVIANDIGKIRFALVVPMQSLRKTIQKVFKTIKGLSPDMVISPIDVPKGKYDLLIVDEAHRLRQRKALSQYPNFDRNNKKLKLEKDGTELDWIMKCSKIQLLFYDSMQSIKPSDIDPEYLINTVCNANYRKCSLKSQLRCLGGEDYIEYVKRVMAVKETERSKIFEGYDLKFFDNIEAMAKEIKLRDQENGLSRIVAGFAWKWITKKKENKEKGLHDIVIDGHEYDWNSTAKDWINSPNSINEIGCIHTVQGYDLNYTGVIFGNEIDYDPTTKEIIVDRGKYFDQIGKTALKNDAELKNYIINIYTTLMTRGIKGTYIYVCNCNLREYLRQYFDQSI